MIAKKCSHLKEFVGMEKEVILRHIKDHKWFRNIGDYNEGVADFIENYGWLMRDMYCTAICEHRDTCDISEDLKKSSNEDEDSSEVA